MSLVLNVTCSIMASFLSRTRVGDFIRPKVIASITPDDSIETILQVLNNNKILSAPVCDLSTHTLVGILSMADIALSLVPIIGPQGLERESLRRIEFSGEQFLQLTATKILSVSQIFGKFNEINYPIKISSPLLDVIKMFSKNVHRSPVLSEEGKLMNYLTQTELLQFLAQSMYLLGDTASLSVEALGLCNFGKVIAVKEYDIVLDVVKLLSANSISAVPVVDDYGRLLANFSLSNLKGLKRETFSELLLPIADYLQLQRIKETESFVTVDTNKALRPQTCKATDSFESTVYKIVSTRVHRLWVVDDQMKVIGVISVGDLFPPFIEQSPAQMPIY
jgi:CBS-domain-containing membrane protein